MLTGKINKKVVTDRTSWVHKMVEGIKGLPVRNQKEFLQDSRNIAAAESYLRRALEAYSTLVGIYLPRVLRNRLPNIRR
jgi:hypothetical protein